MKQFYQRILGVLLAGAGLVPGAQAQKGSFYSQYMANSLLINPAVAGMENFIDVRTSTRKQWVGIDDSPASIYVSANGPIGYNDRNVTLNQRPKEGTYASSKVERNNKFHSAGSHHGVGVVMQAETMGLLRTQALNLLYSFHIPLSRKVNFSVGASSGIVRQTFNSAEARVNDLADPSLAGDHQRTLKADLTIGGWFYTKRGYLGITGAHLLKSSDDFKDPFMSDLAISLSPVYLATAGYRINLRPEVAFIPSVLVRKIESGPWMVDMNAKLEYDSRAWVGFSYRDQNAVSLMGGANINHLLSFGYAYDWTTSALKEVNSGSHEVFLGLRLKNKMKVICPQWVW